MTVGNLAPVAGYCHKNFGGIRRNRRRVKTEPDASSMCVKVDASGEVPEQQRRKLTAQCRLALSGQRRFQLSNHPFYISER